MSRGEGAGEGRSWVKLVHFPKPLLEGDAQCFVFEYAISVHCLLKEGSFGTPSVEGTVCASTSASRHSFLQRNELCKKEMSKEGRHESYEYVTSHLMLSGIKYHSYGG